MKKITKKLILFLVRKHLGIEKYRPFQFVGQKSNAVYYFDNHTIQKWWHGSLEESHVSLNWLLNEDCVITEEIKSNQK